MYLLDETDFVLILMIELYNFVLKIIKGEGEKR